MSSTSDKILVALAAAFAAVGYSPADIELEVAEYQNDPVEGVEGVARGMDFMAAFIHLLNKQAGWWTDLQTGADLTCNYPAGEKPKRNVGELLCLVHSEISEAMEGHRKNLNDDKIPHRKMLEVELADAVIRIFDMAAGMGMDIGGAIAEKLLYNMQRADHKPENRQGDNGKKY